MSSKQPAYRKGDVVLVAFPYTTDDGQTQTKRRPAVIISNDYNNVRLDDVLLVPLTSNVTRAQREPTQVVVEMATPEGKAGGIRLDSVIDCTVIATIPKTLLVNKIGAFPNEVMERVDQCLMIALSIGRPVQEDRPDRPEDGFGASEELDPAAPIPEDFAGESSAAKSATDAAAAKSATDAAGTKLSANDAAGTKSNGEKLVDRFAKFDKPKPDKPNEEKGDDPPPKRIFRRN